MNAVAKTEPNAVEVTQSHQAPTTEAAAILSLIERAAMNPAVDIDKMERLFEMQKQAMVWQAWMEEQRGRAKIEQFREL